MKHSAIVRADSISPEGVRLTTFEVTFPRYVLAEWNTHRVFSRNSASSRAIPVAKRIQAVQEDPYIPEFGRNQPGMQAGEVLDEEANALAEQAWRNAAAAAAHWAGVLADLEVHKQVANRLLEPFAEHTVIVTSTAWENFLDQRASRRSPLADPAIQPVADLMLDALDASTPQRLAVGEYHLPYVDDEDWEEAHQWAVIRSDLTGHPYQALDLLKRISSARCARVSFLTHDGRRDLTVDLELFHRLQSARPMHASPFEHVATPCACETYAAISADLFPPMAPFTGYVRDVRPDHRGNFQGWDQLRHEIEDAHGLDSLR